MWVLLSFVCLLSILCFLLRVRVRLEERFASRVEGGLFSGGQSSLADLISMRYRYLCDAVQYLRACSADLVAHAYHHCISNPKPLGTSCSSTHSEFVIALGPWRNYVGNLVITVVLGFSVPV